jgi:hypothetical protein
MNWAGLSTVGKVDETVDNQPTAWGKVGPAGAQTGDYREMSVDFAKSLADGDGDWHSVVVPNGGPQDRREVQDTIGT